MSREEALLIHEKRPELLFHRHPDQRFVYLTGQPCPLLMFDQAGKAVCTEYEIRPFNCRRFGCYRPDPQLEPYEAEPLDLPHMRLGCANLSDRLGDRAVRRAYAQLQRKAQRWAVKHGWQPDLTPTQVGSNVTFYRLSH